MNRLITKFAYEIFIVVFSIQLVRDGLDALDLFVGKYLFFWASFYILIKFVHYKVFPDFP